MSNLVTIVSHTNYTDFVSSQCSLNHLCGTLVRQSAWFRLDLTIVMSIINLYLSAKMFPIIASPTFHERLLVFMHALLVRVSKIQWWTHFESMIRYSWHPSLKDKLIPFLVASSLAKLMCLISPVRRGQESSSMMFPFTSNTTPMATELASTYTFILLPSTPQFPRTGSASHTLATISAIIQLREASLTLSFHPVVNVIACCLTNAVATLSQLQARKWP